MSFVRDSENLKAIYEPELQQFLREFGLWDGFHMGLLQCSQCTTNVGLENLFGFIMREGKAPKVICHKPECVEAAYSASRSSPHSHTRSKAQNETALGQ